jgi:Uma2 family endonuclease
MPNAHLPAMFAALKMPPHMTLAEFLGWEPPDDSGVLWQLHDGEPELLVLASDRHGSIQTELACLITAHIRATGCPCRVVIAPGVVPSERSEDNCLVPDLGITCTPPTHLMDQPLVLIEILSSTKVSKTRANVRAYQTIPGVAEIVVVHSSVIAGEVLGRTLEGAWLQQAVFVGRMTNCGSRASASARPCVRRTARRTWQRRRPGVNHCLMELAPVSPKVL